jgi:SAM-dependent methyltransferase
VARLREHTTGFDMTSDGMFSTGHAYDRFMGRWSRELARPFAQFAGVEEGHAILDVGCGTGVLAEATAAIAPCRIMGIDSSASYVAAARSRVATERASFERGDAQRLRFSSDTFDRTLSLLALNFIPDLTAALTEMTRVTRIGGTIAAAVWDYGQGMEMLRFFWDEAIALMPAAAARDERHMPLCRKGELAALWLEGRLTDVREEPLTVQTAFASFEDFWLPFLDKQGPAGAFVADLARPARDELRLRLRCQLIGEGTDRPIVLHARAWAVRGTVAAHTGEPDTLRL